MIMTAYKLAMESFVLLCLVISMGVLGAATGVLQPPPLMYVFGDSTMDVGNNNYLPGKMVPRANMPYYGIDFPGVPTGRFSNGDNIADFLAKSIGFWSSPPPYLLLAPKPGLLVSTALKIGVSYASGGAGILDSTNAGNNIPLSKQVQHFDATTSTMVAKVGSGAVSTLLARSVFLISVGNNDVFMEYLIEQARNRSAEQQQSDGAAEFLAGLISNYSATITELYALGARKFAIINAGLIGCVPAARVSQPAGACADCLNHLAAGFNVALRSLLAGLAPRLPGLVYSLADSFGLMEDIFADPHASGFADIAGACCGSGWLLAQPPQLCLPTSTVCSTRSERDQHVFWDSFHFSQRACFLTAQAFYNGPAKYTTPINFIQLVQSS